MFDRWGWLAAAVVAAALAGGCGPEKRDNGAPPPEAGTPAEGEGEGMEAAGTPAEGMEGGEAAPAPEEGGEAAPAPEGEQAAAPAPEAAPAGPVTLQAGWLGEGEGRKVSVKAGDQEVAQLDPAQPGVSEQLVTFLKQRREAMVAAGQQPKVTIIVPADMPFEQVGQPLLKSAFRAGFKPNKDPNLNEVEYKPSTTMTAPGK